jgi:Fuc2NAc and GlcNAc transferase
MSGSALQALEDFIAAGRGLWITLVVLPVLVYWFASFVTGHIRAYAIAEGVLDIPNARSSHVTPTPRGGGIALLLALAPAIGAAMVLRILASPVAVALLFGGGVVALLGWLDDHGSLSARRRLLWQAVAASAAVFLIGGLPEVRIGAWTLHLGIWGTPLAVIGVVWATNLYNFIDGIDGLAGSQGVLIGIAGGIALLATNSTGLALVAICVAFGSLGFLRWNWPPAQIFMGDVGSGTLGFLFGVLAIASEHEGEVGVFAWSLFAGSLILDATATLLRRWIKGERVLEAHRKHAFVRLVIAGWSHRQVTLAYLIFSLPCALLGILMSLSWEIAPICWVAGALWLVGGYLWIERKAPMFGSA